MENHYEDPCNTSRMFAQLGRRSLPDMQMSWELWKHVLPVGFPPAFWTMEYQWSFNNLQNAMEEGGPLNATNVYLFSSLEPTFILMNDKEIYTCIPIITAVSSSCPPSDKIGILFPLFTLRHEEIVDMQSCNLEWVPYTSPTAAASKAKPRIFILTNQGEGSGNINRGKESGSYVPYFDHDNFPEEASEDRRIRFYKFYPDATNYSPNIPKKTKFINRYYGLAHKVL